ncbi:MAG TPA: HAD family hydrolase [Thermoanaerobaculia bacterium]|jgi:HAD superfamily hydrolase (TIGR01549 family)
MPTTLRAVLFDWDGTLVDTSEASFRCYTRMFEAYGIPFDRETYARTYSPNWYRTFRELGLAEEHWPEADARWLEHFACETVELIDGARELLESVTARRLASGIVTSGSRERVERELVAFGLAQHVHECVYGADLREKKPHPEGLLLCLERLGVAPEAAVYVGDSAEDIEMARAAGVYAIGVPGPYPNRESLAGAKPDALARSLREVLELIDGR